MRLFVVATLLLALAVSAVSGATNTVARSLRLPAGSVTATAGHPLVGDWLQTTAAGPVHITFGADGSVIMRFPDIALSRQGTSFVSGGTGTWEPVGERGAAYTVVRLVSHSNGIDLGTITIRGYLVVSEAGSDYTEDAQLTTVTTRDAVGAIVSVAGAADDALATTATRIEVVGSAVASTFEVHGANMVQSGQAGAVESTVPINYGGGCTTCRL